MSRLPHNIERIKDGHGYRYRGYASDGFCCRLTKRGDGLWHAVAAMTSEHIGKAATLVGMSDVLALAVVQKPLEIAESAKAIPAWEKVAWSDDHKILNTSDKALWSGKFDPPAIGDIMVTMGANPNRVRVTHYEVDDRWLMVWGVLEPGSRDEAGKRGNLAGAEISAVEKQS